MGVYFFTQATDEKEAVEEASAVLELIRDYRLNYPVFIDTEGAGGTAVRTVWMRRPEHWYVKRSAGP